MKPVSKTAIFSILCLLVLFAQQFAHAATLLDQVDQLTPEQAYEFQTKLKSKILKPIPQGIFMRLAVSVSGNLMFTDPDDYKSTIDSAHNRDERLDNMYGLQGSLIWRLTDHFYFGVGGASLHRNSNQKTGTLKYEELSLAGTVGQVQAAYKIWLSERWFLFPLIGVGGIEGQATVEKSDDNVEQTFVQRYSGMGFSALGVVSVGFHLNPIFTAGLDIGYLHAKVNKVKRSKSEEVASPASLDFSGPYIGLRVSYNLR